MDNTDGSKKKLLSRIHKKFNTTMIGALEDFENSFGHLWGHGLQFSQLTDEQIEFREIWSATRSKVLDRGNAQSRAAQDEIARYNISYEGYRTEFIVMNKPLKGDRNDR